MSASVEVAGLVKHFGPIRANDGVDARFIGGEIHALLGENGAGKSTLIRCLAGIYRPDAGEIKVDGERAVIATPNDARALGIAVVHQHSTLVPALTIGENAALQDGTLGLLRKDDSRGLIASVGRLGLTVTHDTLVENLSPGERQRVEIGEAIIRRARILILDEPTSVLSPVEVSSFFNMLRELAAGGVAVVFVTHHLEEAVLYSDQMTVLRAGKVVGRIPEPETVTEAELISLVIGERATRAKLPKGTRGNVLLRAAGVGGAPAWGRSVEGIDLDVYAGEIVAVAGVEGNGQRGWRRRLPVPGAPILAR